MSFEWFDELLKLATTWGITALGGLALIFIGFQLARLVRTTLAHALKRLWLDDQLADVLSSLAYYLTMAVVLIAAESEPAPEREEAASPSGEPEAPADKATETSSG